MSVVLRGDTPAGPARLGRLLRPGVQHGVLRQPGDPRAALRARPQVGLLTPLRSGWTATTNGPRTPPPPRERTTADGRTVVRYVVRWRDPHGAQQTMSFGRRAEAGPQHQGLPAPDRQGVKPRTARREPATLGPWPGPWKPPPTPCTDVTSAPSSASSRSWRGNFTNPTSRTGPARTSPDPLLRAGLLEQEHSAQLRCRPGEHGLK